MVVVAILFLWAFIGVYHLRRQTSLSPVKLEVIRPAKQRRGTMNYFIAGMFARPETAFKFLDHRVWDRKWSVRKRGELEHSSILNGEGITLVDFSNFGLCAEKVRQAIKEDAAKYRHVRIYAISTGAIFAGWEGCYNADLYLIDPCVSNALLKPSLRHLLWLVYPVEIIGYFILGPLMALPFLPNWEGQRFSPAMILSLLRAIIENNDDNGDRIISAKFCGVTISLRDKIMDGEKMEDFYTARYNRQVVFTDTSFGNTLNQGYEYFKAIEKLKKLNSSGR